MKHKPNYRSSSQKRKIWSNSCSDWSLYDTEFKFYSTIQLSISLQANTWSKGVLSDYLVLIFVSEYCVACFCIMIYGKNPHLHCICTFQSLNLSPYNHFTGFSRLDNSQSNNEYSPFAQQQLSDSIYSNLFLQTKSSDAPNIHHDTVWGDGENFDF